jgi:thiol-disulfide isomerase/thioredoxin
MKPIFRWGLFGLAAVCVILAARILSTPSSPLAAPEFSGTQAPEFPSELSWINTDKPLSLKKLHGKIILLDFWTYGCINCIHIIPDLEKLQKKYADQLVIIGVHSAKFQNEKDAANIRSAVLRYHIDHPVVVDNNLQVWNAYGVNAWPTLILIDPSGRIAERWAGEGQFANIDAAITGLVKTFRSRNELNESPLNIALDSARVARTPLLFPGKVLSQNGKLYVADTGHNRIIETDSAGKVLSVVGNGQSGLTDGDFNTAQFNAPQGMTLSADGKVLFVADTNNHAIRAIDFANQTVTTIAGTGEQANYGSSGGIGTNAALSSPWDLCRVGDIIYIAMAGNHQIWSLNLDNKLVNVFAGSGSEARTDGSRRFAAFAQPSGLVTNGKVLFVADSESSSIRQVDLPGNGDSVKTLAGGDLFDFGDNNGVGMDARFQHPLGVATDGKVLFIADAYNHQIRKLDLTNNNVSIFLGSSRGMATGKKPMFYEPGGLSLDGKKLYIADTNNNRILVDDLTTGEVTALNINVPLPVAGKINISTNKKIIPVPKVLLAPNTKSIFSLNVTLPAGHHLNTMSPLGMTLDVKGTGLQFAQTSIDKAHFHLPLNVSFTTAQSGSGTVHVDANVYYCTNDFGLCEWKELRFDVPYSIGATGKNVIALSHTIDR